jgi:hypothetical protein
MFAKRSDAVEKHRELISGHNLVTGAPPKGGAPLRAAANDGTTRTNGAGDRTRTDNLRLMNAGGGAQPAFLIEL